MIGKDIGIVVYANNALEAMQKAENELLQGWGGSIEFCNENDQEEYDNAEV